MRPVKQILLGSAAGLFAVAGAQAADLAVKAAPVEYVKVCSLYGAGFWYIPGTDTCIKIGGFVRLEVNFNADGGSPPAGTGGGAAQLSGGFSRASAQMGFRERSMTSFDARTQTEYGTLRSYFDIGQVAATPLSTVSGTSSINPLGAQTGGNYAVYTDRAFLQFAGFTAGRMRSFFDMVFLAAYQNAASRYTGDSSPAGITGIAYTWQFGGGLSASLSLEDGGWSSGGHGRSTVNLAGGGTPAAASDVTTAFGIGLLETNNKQDAFFDPVANIRLDQAWGFVGASVALHDASGGYYGNNFFTTVQPTGPTGQPIPGACNGTTICGHPGDKFGYAASVGGTWVNAFGLQGDTLAAQAVYAVGAAGYATGSWGSSAIYSSGNKVGLSYIVDGVYDYGTGVQLTKMWSVNGVYEHLWNERWKTSLTAGAMGIDFDGGKALICPNGAGTQNPVGFTSASAVNTNVAAFNSTSGSAGVTNCNPNSTWFGLGTRTMWTPHPDIDISLDFHWEHLDTAFGGQGILNALGTVFQPGAGARPGGLYQISNQDVFSAHFAIRRGFVY